MCFLLCTQNVQTNWAFYIMHHACNTDLCHMFLSLVPGKRSICVNFSRRRCFRNSLWSGKWWRNKKEKPSAMPRLHASRWLVKFNTNWENCLWQRDAANCIIQYRLGIPKMWDREEWKNITPKARDIQAQETLLSRRYIYVDCSSSDTRSYVVSSLSSTIRTKAFVHRYHITVQFRSLRQTRK